MKKKICVAFSLVFFILNLYSQQFGDGVGLSAYEYNLNSNPNLSSGYYCVRNNQNGPTTVDWLHFITYKHLHNNGYALQMAAPYHQSKKMFYRLVNNGSFGQWHEIATRGENTFEGKQVFNDNVSIGTSDASARLVVKAEVGKSIATKIFGSGSGDMRRFSFYASPHKNEPFSLYVYNETGVVFDILRLGHYETTKSLSINGTTGNMGLGINPSSTYKFIIRQSISNNQAGLKIENHNNTKSLQAFVGTHGAVIDAEGSTNLHLRTGGVDRVYINNSTGNIGIRTTNPQAHLHVNGTSRFDGRIDIRENGNTDGYLVRLTGSTSPYSGSGNGQLLSISSFAGKSFYSTTQVGTAILGKVFNWGGNLAYSGQFINGAFKIARDEEPTTIPDFYVSTAGNVGIGTDIIPEGYKLAVKGSIAATRVTVKTSLAWSWPDYVFADDYKLMPLQDVKQFVATNKHLPDVPCEKSVSENGIDVGEMQAVLLKKIEELTLYLFEQDKKYEDQAQLIENLQKEIKELKNK